MIDAKTLHIGSHVNLDNKRAKIVSLEPYSEAFPCSVATQRYGLRVLCHLDDMRDIEPIPITEELLRELGFEGSKWHGGNLLTKHIGEYSIRLIYKGSNEWDCNIYTSYSSCRLAMYRNLQFLHELEAMFYMTTKTELIED